MVEMVTGQIGAEGRYWESLAEGRLELPRCRGCGQWHWPAVWRCGACGSWDHEWVEQAMTGTVFTWTRTWHPFGGTEGFAKPFVTALVTLDSVPIRINGVVEGPDEAIAIGQNVVGHVGRTPFQGSEIPAMRWRLMA